jgi:hypothetical protein
LHLKDTSPAIDAGLTSRRLVGLRADPRPVDGNLDGTAMSDIGADEYCAGVMMPTAARCDNCPSIANGGQENQDGDPGDMCDNCPAVSNAEGQASDADGDLAGDACDGAGTGNVDCSFSVTSVDALKVRDIRRGCRAQSSRVSTSGSRVRRRRTTG